MNWIKSLKEKSFSVVQDYKNEFSSFVLSLKEEISDAKNINDEEKNSTELETFKNKNKSRESIRDTIQKFIDIDEIKEDDLQKFLKNTEKKKNVFDEDPNLLVLIERKDFTNFQIFWDMYKNENQLINDISLLDIRYSKYNNKQILRFFYNLIYELSSILNDQTGNDPIFEKIEQVENNIDNMDNENNKFIEKTQNSVFEQEDSIFGDNITLINRETENNSVDENKLKTDNSNEWEYDEKLIFS